VRDGDLTQKNEMAQQPCGCLQPSIRFQCPVIELRGQYVLVSPIDPPNTVPLPQLLGCLKENLKPVCGICKFVFSDTDINAVDSDQARSLE
jgi:hypothetical protein